MKIINFLIVVSCFNCCISASAQQVAGRPSTVGKAQLPEKKTTAQFPAASQFANSKFTYKIIPAANNTWCYDIIADGRMMIHQPSVPGLPGNEGFKTKAAAQKVADLVIQKIKKGEMPPSVTKEDMQKIGVL